MCSLFLRRSTGPPKVDGTSWNLMELNAKTPGKQYKKLLKMVIEIVDLPIKKGDFPEFFVSLPEGKLSSVLTGCFLVLITALGRVWQGVQAETFMSSFPKQTNTKEHVSSS